MNGWSLTSIVHHTVLHCSTKYANVWTSDPLLVSCKCTANTKLSWINSTIRNDTAESHWTSANSAKAITQVQLVNELINDRHHPEVLNKQKFLFQLSWCGKLSTESQWRRDNVFFLVKFELKQGKNRRSDKKVVIQKGLKFVRLNFIYVVAADVNKFFLNFLSLTVGGWEQFWSRKEVYINI